MAGTLTESKLPSKVSLLAGVRWEHCAAGVSGGVISTLVLHPLDLIKVRFQVHEGSSTVTTKRPQYHGVIDAFLTIQRHEGLRGLYRGVTPNVWGSGASWGLYFLFYSSFKTYMQNGDDMVSLSATKHTMAAAEAGVMTLMFTNPIWVAKTRMCLQYDVGVKHGANAVLSDVHYNGMADCLIKTFRSEGFPGLYKGFIPGLFGVSHGAIQFMTYEELKKMYNRHRNKPLNTTFNTGEYLLFAAISKMIAASVTYPYQVVRARLQDQHRNYSGVWEVVIKTWRYEGLRGLFKGLTPYLLHVTPNICIVFLIYENVTHMSMFRPHKYQPASYGSVRSERIHPGRSYQKNAEVSFNDNIEEKNGLSR
ncbi:hypothetical protein LSH36_40g10033 [Paralvinella palmiformis]|uniref:Solute carrier family 25 member 32 n=1 Tax=Paralvinella palmiformis TaxID=53620 RepID=A0AAD9K7G3_9ANNE|nr:hypothetical protein LSH36_40g10033 [Paralvinella palmiformis]